jgi:hypothetical protein
MNARASIISLAALIALSGCRHASSGGVVPRNALTVTNQVDSLSSVLAEDYERDGTEKYAPGGFVVIRYKLKSTRNVGPDRPAAIFIHREMSEVKPVAAQ